MLFRSVLRTTDILWTKPSELSFYAALGLPIVMSPPLGSQETFNRRWLLKIGAGIDQPESLRADRWLRDALDNGELAQAAWNGYEKAEKNGTYRIMDILQ